MERTRFHNSDLFRCPSTWLDINDLVPGRCKSYNSCFRKQLCQEIAVGKTCRRLRRVLLAAVEIVIVSVPFNCYFLVKWFFFGVLSFMIGCSNSVWSHALPPLWRVLNTIKWCRLKTFSLKGMRSDPAGVKNLSVVPVLIWF